MLSSYRGSILDIPVTSILSNFFQITGSSGHQNQFNSVEFYCVVMVYILNQMQTPTWISLLFCLYYFVLANKMDIYVI